MNELREELRNIKTKYLNVYDEKCLKDADGDLAKLMELRNEINEYLKGEEANKIG